MTDWKSNSEYWDNRYTNQLTGWDRGEVHPALDAWLASGDLQPCQIVLPGCGNGHEVLKLVDHGFDVTAIDYAEAPVNTLRSLLRPNMSSASVHQADIFEFKPLQPFDVVYEQTCLCAIEPSKRTAYEKTVFEWLGVNGKLLVLFMQNENERDEPPFHCDIEEMRNVFAERRWTWPVEPLIKYEHPSGKLFEFAAILHRRG